MQSRILSPTDNSTHGLCLSACLCYFLLFDQELDQDEVRSYDGKSRRELHGMTRPNIWIPGSWGIIRCAPTCIRWPSPLAHARAGNVMTVAKSGPNSLSIHWIMDQWMRSGSIKLPVFGPRSLTKILHRDSSDSTPDNEFSTLHAMKRISVTSSDSCMNCYQKAWTSLLGWVSKWILPDVLPASLLMKFSCSLER